MPSRSSHIEAIEELFRQEYGRIVVVLTIKVGERETAEECAQDAFVELVHRWKRVSKYRDPKAWLWLVALRRADKVRRRKHRTEPTLWPSGESRDLDALIDLHNDVRRLPRRQRDVVILHYFADLTVSEIAVELRIAEGTVKSELHDARASLRGMDAEGRRDESIRTKRSR